VLREAVRETRMSAAALIYPVFVTEGRNIREPIPAMPGQFRWSADSLPRLYDSLLEGGINKVILFGVPSAKDGTGSGASSPDGVIQRALRLTKESVREIYAIADLCLCEYTNHGHCGILRDGAVDNDLTLDALALAAVSQAQSGADMVAPSGMMDGGVKAVRRALDAANYAHVPIMAYSAKYASAFYGPFRDAARSAPATGDRRGYQMDWHNSREALKEADADIEEGADIVMVKPALAYLDVIRAVSRAVRVPVAAYSVSGEYSMIKAASAAGYLDEGEIVRETAVAVFRAGAGLLISYYAPELSAFIRDGLIG
jgi:porphobilinogen synthase